LNVVEETAAEQGSASTKKYIKRVRAHTLKEMMHEILSIRNEQRSEFEENIKLLAGKGILLRGYNLRCNHCDLETWYDLSEVTEWVVCKGCRLPFQMNTQATEFAYLLNQLFFNGLSQGASSVILTALLLHRSSQYSMMWQAGYELRKTASGDNTVVEIDLIAMCDGLLIVAECKNSFDDSTEEARDKLKKQLLRNIETAKSIDAAIFFFATLRETVSSEIIEFLKSIDKAESTLAVRLATREELLEGRLFRIDPTSGKKESIPIWSLAKREPFGNGEEYEHDPSGCGGMLML
jgi:hypothetical protein